MTGRRVLHIERHQFGPRVYVIGQRIHEVGVGLGLLGLLAALLLAEVLSVHMRPVDAAGIVGTWLVAKDWRDLFPSKRNTAAWGWAAHRVRR